MIVLLLQPKEPPAAAKTFQVQSEGSANPHSSGYLPTLDEDQMWDPDQPRCLFNRKIMRHRFDIFRFPL